ncbi:MAG: DinB family protein, partial [Pseudonocardiaceae bacterium]
MSTPITELGTVALREHLAAELTRTRARSAALTDAVDDGELTRQHSRIMSPLVWDLAHIGNQEELWLIRDVAGRDPVRADIDHLYDAFKHPRSDRPALPLLDPAEARGYLGEVRHKVLDVLERTPLEGRRLVADGFAFGMIVQHEQQHDETMLATHQLRGGPAALHAPAPTPRRTTGLPTEVLIPAGEFTMGTSTEPWALDNERPAHRAYTGAYWLATTPVTNGEYQGFLADGGYHDPRWWSERGWTHRCEANVVAPQFW